MSDKKNNIKKVEDTKGEQEIEEVKPDHDTYWKKVITFFFSQFILYFFPKLYKEVDWKKPIVFLEQEFQEIIKTRYKGKQIVDKLAKLHLKNGKKSFVLLHAEPQSTWESDFPHRMLVYYYHIDLKYTEKDYEFTAIALYTGKDIPKKNDTYKRSFHGTEITYKFNTCVVEKLSEAELLASDNPIALALLAAKYEHQSRKQEIKRFGFKKKLVTLLYGRNYSAQATRTLLEFIKYVVVLPMKFDLSFNEFIKTKTTEKNMRNNVRPTDKKWLDDLYFSTYGETPDMMADRKAALIAKEVAKKVEAEVTQKVTQKVAAEEAKKAAEELKKAEIQLKKVFEAEKAKAIEIERAKAIEFAKALEAEKVKALEAEKAKTLAAEKAKALEAEKKERQQEKITFAKVFLQNKNLTKEYIALITKLPVETIEALANNQRK